jgi:hypothetical protein
VAGSPLVPADTEPPVALDLGPPPEGDPLEADLDPSRPYQS